MALLHMSRVVITIITLRIRDGSSWVLGIIAVGIDAESCLIVILRNWLGGDDILRVERNVDV